MGASCSQWRNRRARRAVLCPVRPGWGGAGLPIAGAGPGGGLRAPERQSRRAPQRSGSGGWLDQAASGAGGWHLGPCPVDGTGGGSDCSQGMPLPVAGHSPPARHLRKHAPEGRVFGPQSEFSSDRPCQSEIPDAARSHPSRSRSQAAAAAAPKPQPQPLFQPPCIASCKPSSTFSACLRTRRLLRSWWP